MRMMVPIPVEQLNKAHAALDQAAGMQAISGKGGLRGISAVHFEGLFALTLEVEHFRGAGLHPKRQFISGDARGDLWIASIGKVEAVQTVDGIDRPALGGGVDSNGIGKIENRFAGG